MKVNWGALIVDGRGKLGGHVGQKNTYGNVLRTKVTPVNRRSPAQQKERVIVAELTQSWSVLTEEERASWISFALTLPFTDIFGNTYFLTGMNLYVKVNLNLASVGEERKKKPIRKAITKAVYAVQRLFKPYPDGMIIDFGIPIDVISKLNIFMTPQLSPGVSSGGTLFKHVTILDSTSTLPYDVQDEYSAIFGRVEETGPKIFIKVVQIDISSGLANPPVIDFGIVEPVVPP